MRCELRVIALLVLLATRAVAQEPANSKVDDKPVTTFAGHESAVTGLAFSPDGRQVTSASIQDTRTWDATTGKEISVLKGVGGQVVAFSLDTKSLAIAGREAVKVHDVASGKVLLSFDPHGDWDPTFPFRPVISAVAFTPDGKKLATAGSITKVGGRHGYPGGAVTIWDAKTGKSLHRFDKLSTGAGALAISADGLSVAGGTNGAGGELAEPSEVWVWDIEKGTVVRALQVAPDVEPGEFISTADVAFSPNGKRIAVAVSAGSRARPVGLLLNSKPSTIRLWELPNGKELQTLQGHTKSLERIAFSPDGKQLASAGGDRTVRIWSTTTGKELKALRFDVARIDALTFSPDSRRLAAGGGDSQAPGKILVWDCRRD